MDAKDLDALRTKEYWNARYLQEPEEHQFDWFKSYDDLSPWLNEVLRFEDKILMLGCGNSVRSQPALPKPR
jgi:EEF1A lysine methyltransferase 4